MMEAPFKLSFSLSTCRTSSRQHYSTFRKAKKKKERKERLFQFLVSSMAGWTHFTEEILTKSIMHNMGAFSEKRKTPNIDKCNLRDKIPAVKLTALSGLCWSGLHERQPVWNTATIERDRKQTTLKHQLVQLSRLDKNYFLLTCCPVG